MKSYHEQVEEVLKGCGEDLFMSNCLTPDVCDKFNLCPTCKIKAQTLLECGKDELEFLKTIIFNIREYFVGQELKENIKVRNKIRDRIEQFESDIKLLKGALK